MNKRNLLSQFLSENISLEEFHEGILKASRSNQACFFEVDTKHGEDIPDHAEGFFCFTGQDKAVKMKYGDYKNISYTFAASMIFRIDNLKGSFIESI